MNENQHKNHCMIPFIRIYPEQRASETQKLDCWWPRAGGRWGQWLLGTGLLLDFCSGTNDDRCCYAKSLKYKELHISRGKFYPKFLRFLTTSVILSQRKLLLSNNLILCLFSQNDLSWGLQTGSLPFFFFNVISFFTERQRETVTGTPPIHWLMTQMLSPVFEA